MNPSPAKCHSVCWHWKPIYSLASQCLQTHCSHIWIIGNLSDVCDFVMWKSASLERPDASLVKCSCLTRTALLKTIYRLLRDSFHFKTDICLTLIPEHLVGKASRLIEWMRTFTVQPRAAHRTHRCILLCIVFNCVMNPRWTQTKLFIYRISAPVSESAWEI